MDENLSHAKVIIDRLNNCMVIKLYSNIGPLASFLLALTPLLYGATTNADLLHDPLMFNPAAYLVQGKTLYLDVYSIFGPLIAWLNYPFLYFFGVKLIVTRFVGVLIYWITGILLYIILKNRVNKKIALILSISWMLTNKGLSYLDNHDSNVLIYSTNFGVFFILLSYYFFNKKFNFQKSKTLQVIASSFILASASAVRIEYLLSWVFLALAFIFFKQTRYIVRNWIVGGLIFITCFLLYLSLTNSLEIFFKSTFFYFPIIAEINNPIGENLFYTLAPVIILMILATLFVIQTRIVRYLHTAPILVGSIVSTLTLIKLNQFIRSNWDYNFYGIQINKWLGLIIGYLPSSYVAFLYLVLPLLVFRKKSIFHKNHKIETCANEFQNILFITVICLSIYFYIHIPKVDYMHAYVPLVIIGLIAIIGTKSVTHLNSHRYFEKFLVMIVVYTSIIFLNNIESEKYHYQTGVLTGMSDTNKKRADEIDAKFQSYRAAVEANEHFQLTCEESLLIVSTKKLDAGRYYSIEEDFVFDSNWCALPLS